MRGRPFMLRLMGAGVRRPKHRVPGTDLAGRVVSVGRDVTRFSPGDEVFGESIAGYAWRNGGAFAEYACVPDGAPARKPAAVSFEQAAAVPSSGLIALRGLRDEGRLQPGAEVLVNGAGGGVGTLAVQIAKADGAHVTGVDGAAKSTSCDRSAHPGGRSPSRVGRGAGEDRHRDRRDGLRRADVTFRARE